MLHTKNKKVAALFAAGALVTFGVYRGHRITDGPAAGFQQPIAGRSTIGWPKPQPTTRIVTDDLGTWCEVGIRMPAVMPGNAADGWRLVGELLRLQSSTDLVNWESGGFANAAGSPVANGDGSKTYWSRAAVPLVWNVVTLDAHAVSDRAFKNITDIAIGAVTIALPGYPYAMPASAATLQADLIAAGYAGATVSSTPGTLRVEVRNYEYVSGMIDRSVLLVTLSGADVTAVATPAAVLISLPGYPYAMPGQQAALQADLRAAGQSGAVVKLYGDEWRIDLPDRLIASSALRNLTLTIQPDDPYPDWDFYGTYLGLAPDATISGTYDNLRASGVSLSEADKQFFRY
jgi:hypothetical protein